MLLASALVALTFAASTPAQVRQALDRVYAADSFQTELSAPPALESMPRPAVSRPTAARRAWVAPASWLASALLWVAAIVVALVLVVWVATRWRFSPSN